MAAPLKRVMPTHAAPAPVGVNFGSLDMYAAGGGLPEGNYCWTELVCQMFQAVNAAGQSKGASRLGVMITLQNLADLSDAGKHTQFYSMGTKAHLSFAPNAETGKGVVAVPGGPASKLNDSTNWAMLLKSLYDSGLPQSIFTNDLSVLEGIHVHMANVPEPAERAGFQSQTGEAAEERKPGTIAIVNEILETGKPWEGTGGIPTEAQAAPAKPVIPSKVPIKPVLPPKPAPKPVPVAATTEGPTEEDMMQAAVAGVSSVLEKNEAGCTKLLLRTGTFKAVKAQTESDDMAQAIIETFFASDDALNSVLSQVGFTVSGSQIKPL